MHPLSVTARIGKVIQIHEHAILIHRHIVAQLIHKVQYRVAVLIDSPVVMPVLRNQLQFLASVFDIPCELLTVLETRRMEVHEEVDDSREEVDGRILKERLRAAFLVATLVE